MQSLGRLWAPSLVLETPDRQASLMWCHRRKIERHLLAIEDRSAHARTRVSVMHPPHQLLSITKINEWLSIRSTVTSGRGNRCLMMLEFSSSDQHLNRPCAGAGSFCPRRLQPFVGLCCHLSAFAVRPWYDRSNMHPYMHACLHTCILTYMPTCLHKDPSVKSLYMLYMWCRCIARQIERQRDR